MLERLAAGDLSVAEYAYEILASGHRKLKPLAARALESALEKAGPKQICAIRLSYAVRRSGHDLKSLLTDDMTESERFAAAVFASFDPNGYVREDAVKYLAGRKGALPYLLIRCGDWVPQVRGAALNALSETLHPAFEDDVVGSLYFLKALLRRDRADKNSVFSKYLVLFSNNTGLLEYALSSGDASAKSMCIRAVRAGVKPSDGFILSQLSQEKDPFIRGELFRAVESCGKNADDAAYLLLNDKYPRNRAAALEHFSRTFPERAKELAAGMLGDKNASIRACARSIVASSAEDFDFRGYYRALMSRDTAVALCGIGETGSADDCAAVEPYLKSPAVGVVRAAIYALARLDGKRYTSTFLGLISSARGSVAAAAFKALEKSGDYSAEAVYNAAAESGDESAFLRALRLISKCGKWDRLLYTLMIRSRGGVRLIAACDKSLSVWLARSNRSYNALSGQKREQIIALIPEKGFDDLRFAVR